MSEITIHIEEDQSKGSAYVGDPADPKAAMTFSKAGTTRVIIDHTEVSDELRNQKVGRKMLDAIIAMARSRQLKIIPLCPYARSEFEKDPSIRDVLRS